MLTHAASASGEQVSRWRTLPSDIRDALEAGTRSIARVREGIAADAKVQEMPLVRVHNFIVMNPENTGAS